MSAKTLLRELWRLEEKGRIKLDPRSMLDVVRIIDLVGEENTEALAHSLASRLTHEPDQYDSILKALLACGPDPVAPAAADSRPHPLQRPKEPAPDEPPTHPRRTWHIPGLSQLPGEGWVALLSLCSLVLVLGLPFLIRPEPPPPPPPPPPTTTLPPTTRLEPIEDSRRSQSSIREERPITRPGPPWLIYTLILGGVAVLVIGAAWWGAPSRYRDLLGRARARARAQRETWGEQGHVSAVPYHIERVTPFAPAHIDDAATILGRLFRRDPGAEIDVPATITATIDAGGRITPVHATSRLREHLLVLVDRESRQHPYLDGVESLLARWRRLGLRVLRYDYHNTLTSLHPERGPELTLDTLRSQTEGLPLLVFSRMRGARGYQGRVALTRALDPWPVRAWLDLDPTPLAERDRERRRLALTLEHSGLPRYPFTAVGLLAAARGLAEGFPRNRLALASPPAGGLDTALMVWAGTVACVPDASWAQLDALRRHFAGFAELTPDHTPLDARDLERLLVWVSDHDYHSGALGEGERLYFTPAGRRALLKALRRHDKMSWPSDRDARYEARARALLRKQLLAADLGDDPYRRALRDMKVAIHDASLDPALADALLPGFADKAVAYELIDHLADELAVQAEGAAFDTPWSARTSEAIAAFVQGDHGKDRARLPDLLGLPRLGTRQALAAAALVLASAGSWALWWTTRPTMHVVEQTRTIETPPTWKVVTVSGRDPLVALAAVAPMKFRKLPGGTFEMGSPANEKDRSDDERLHSVEVSAFELAETEVTNAQWKAVMGTSPSNCDYGCADNQPVQTVTWVMAVEYLNKLTAHENTGLTACYEQTGDDWAWIQGCTGYRLPTEAEWEYAARAGTKTAYSFGDAPAKLGEYAWFTENSGDKTHPVGEKLPNPWELHDMHGNVWEWVWDRYDYKYGDNDNDKVTRDPRGPQNGDRRVLRGGSFRLVPGGLRSAFRYWVGPTHAYGNNGFRCARGSPPAR